MGPSVVLLEKDPKVAQYLAFGLRPHFHSVDVMESHDALRERVSANQPQALVLDIENWRLSDVEKLHRDFPEMPIVCTHRIPDEELWTAALEAGASLEEVTGAAVAAFRSEPGP